MGNQFSGVIPPVITPFTADGQIDFEGFDVVIEHLLAGGVHGLFVLGSSGEVAYLTDGQREAIVARAVATTAGRVPVLAGAIEATTARVVEQARRLEALGADAIVTTAPFYAINDRGEIAEHFRSVSAAIGIPLFAYDVPVRLGGVKLDHEMLVALGSEGVIQGVKDSSGNDVAFRRLVASNQEAGRPLTLLTGHECVVDGMLLLGADGMVPGYANVDPVRYASLWQLAQKGDWASARKMQDDICRGFEIVFIPEGRSGDAAGVGAFKTAMQSLGIIRTNAMAHPVQPLDASTVARIREVLATAAIALPAVLSVGEPAK